MPPASGSRRAASSAVSTSIDSRRKRMPSPVFSVSGEVVAAVSVCINKALLGADRGARHRDAALAVAAALTGRLGGDPARSQPAPEDAS